VTSLAVAAAKKSRLRARLPGYSIRLRLTVFYAALFLVCGAALLALTYLLVAHHYHGGLFTTTRHNALTRTPGRPETVTAVSSVGLAGLIVESLIALAIMAVVCLWLGWLVAGRVLRPLRTITDTVRQVSASDLHRRLALEGPDDELRRLGATFDHLLARLEAAFESQRRFIAHASHELRTPLTVQRSLVQVALADPNNDNASLRAMGEDVLDAGKRQERLIEALLTLSRSQAGLDRREPIALASITQDVVDGLDHDDVTMGTTLKEATINGDPELIHRLLVNLIGNAVRHNHPGGRVDVATGDDGGAGTLTIRNTGPRVPADQLPRLLQPFHTLGASQSDPKGGLGLGLSIVDAITKAHGAALTVDANPDGGLCVQIRFQRPTAESR
jgi:signal transduction histidine kinase